MGKGRIVTYFAVAAFGIVVMLTADPFADFLQHWIPFFPVETPSALEKLKSAISDVGIGIFVTTSSRSSGRRPVATRPV